MANTLQVERNEAIWRLRQMKPPETYRMIGFRFRISPVRARHIALREECRQRWLRDRGIVKQHQKGGVPPSKREIMATKIDAMLWSIRLTNCLLHAGIGTVGELIKLTSEDLLQIKNFGKVSLKEVMDELAEIGMSLKNGVGGQNDKKGEKEKGDTARGNDQRDPDGSGRPDYKE